MKPHYPLQLLCETFDVSRSGYYAHQARLLHPGPRRQRDAALLGLLETEFADSDRTYGSPRLHRALHARQEPVSRKRVARLMRQAGLRGCSPVCRRVITTDSRHDQPIAPNLLAQRVRPTRPNEVWVADITYIPTDEGWLYLAGVKDLYSRKLVGWAMSEDIDTTLVLSAWHYARDQRRPEPGLLFHSDRGGQHARATFRADLASAGVVQSMSRRGNCYDNAMMESGWASLKIECVYRHHFRTRAEARAAIFTYLHFYNRRRRHSALGYLFPVDFENLTN
ncbi:MAG: IS3 family transposase [Verrucomicrobiota bacterium]